MRCPLFILSLIITNFCDIICFVFESIFVYYDFFEVNPTLAEKKQRNNNNSSSTKRKNNNSTFAQKKRRASSSAKKTTQSRGANTRKKTKSRAEWERQRRRLIAAMILFLVSVLFILLYFIKGENIWLTLHQIYIGLFGFFGFAVPAVTFYCCWQNGKDEPAEDFKSKILLGSFLIITLASILFSFQNNSADIAGYFPELHKSFVNGSNGAGGGFIGALLGIPLTKLLGSAGSGIVCILAAILLFAFTFDDLTIALIKLFRKPVKRVSENISDRHQINSEVRKRRSEIIEQQRRQKREEFVRTEIDRRVSGKPRSPGNPDYRKVRRSPFYTPESSPLPPPPEESPAPVRQKKKRETEPPVQPVIPETDTPEIEDTELVPDINEGDIFDISKLLQEEKSENRYSDDIVTAEEKNVTDPESEKKTKKKKSAGADDFVVEPENQIIVGHYIRPPFNLLEPQPPEQEANISMELNQSGEMLIETLKSFGVTASIVNISRGPSVTRYELQPAAGIKISKITNLSDDIAMSLAAIGVRIEAPIPGKSAVGIEVPNKNVSIVKMRSLVESREFRDAKSKLTVALGKDITGRTTLADLGKMPHLLIAGSTGSGKSVCVNSMLVSLLYKSSPDEVKFILIDPKVVELGVYNGIPHLLVPVVTDPRKAAGALNWAVNEMLKRYKTFAEYNVRDMHSYNRLVDRQNAEFDEMQAAEIHNDNDDERTFEEDEMLAQAQADLKNNPDEITDDDKPQRLTKMPQIVIVIDELADLMMAAPKDVEEAICRLAQMARAAGMHLVIATQRPSVDVITGLIKANIPSRIAFAVKSQTDSRTILDTGGAEKLLGKGDMLFSPIGTTKPIRVQGCFVDDVEIENIINFIKKNKVVEYDEDVLRQIENSAIAENGNEGDNNDGDYDPMLDDAVKCVVEAGQASTSMLQRRFRVGYARAGRLIDEMEQLGIVGPHEGSKPRQVLMTYQQWMERNLTSGS